MRAYRNPAAEEAVGVVNKEWARMARLAIQIREGRGNPVWIYNERKKFTGIFKRLLDDPIDYVKQQARYKH